MLFVSNFNNMEGNDMHSHTQINPQAIIKDRMQEARKVTDETCRIALLSAST